MQTLNDSTIEDFAASVRLELRDLPKSVVEELTGDLEASLQERREDEGDEFQLGSPTDYAAELREAAGVSPKPARTRAFSSKSFVASIESWFRKYAITRAILEFGFSIRPLWWVLRAVIAWVIFGNLLSSTTSAIVLVTSVFLSVQWGRKKWFTNRFFAALLLPLNLLAMILVIPAQDSVLRNINAVSSELDYGRALSNNGLNLNGSPIDEIQTFDAKGNLVTGLTFKDSSGNTLLSTPSSAVTVPELAGMNLFEVQQALGLIGLNNVDIVYENNATELTGVVSRTDPAAGQSISTDSTITIYLDK
jgi:uncharacterized membrane protein